MLRRTTSVLLLAALAGCAGRDRFLTGDGAIPEADVEYHVAHAMRLTEDGRDAASMEHWRKAIRGGSRDFDVLVRASRAASRLTLAMDVDHGGRAEMAREALAWAETATAQNPDRPRGLFAHALALGLLSESSSLESSVDGLIDLTTRLIAVSERFEHAGGRRMRGMVYLRAPDLWGGDLDQALEDLARAVELFPAFAENRVAYAEALLEDDDAAAARAQLAATGTLERDARVEAWRQELLARLEDS
jgi:tetratricopeptide (TPR) repeat protein